MVRRVFPVLLVTGSARQQQLSSSSSTMSSNPGCWLDVLALAFVVFHAITLCQPGTAAWSVRIPQQSPYPDRWRHTSPAGRCVGAHGLLTWVM